MGSAADTSSGWVLCLQTPAGAGCCRVLCLQTLGGAGCCVCRQLPCLGAVSADRCGSPRKEREAQVTAKEDAGHRERSDEVWVTAKEYEVLPKKRGAGAGAGQVKTVCGRNLFGVRLLCGVEHSSLIKDAL